MRGNLLSLGAIAAATALSACSQPAGNDTAAASPQARSNGFDLQIDRNSATLSARAQDLPLRHIRQRDFWGAR